MKREILFRRVHKNRQTAEIKFTYWGPDGDTFRGPSHISGWDTVRDEQFTGRTDKNGTKIFEGDIVRTFRGRTYQVTWSESRYQWVFKDVKPIYEVNESYEVIGNIHDTPELITSEKL